MKMTTCTGLKLWPGSCIGKESAGDNTKVITTFTQNNETVMNFMTQLSQSLEANQESNVTASNDTSIGKIVIGSMTAKGENSKTSLSITANQSNEITAISTISSLIEAIQNSTASADTKLDTLATISAAAENTSVVASASSESDTTVNNTSNIYSKTITDISNTLNQVAVLCGKNNIGLEGIEIGSMSATDGGEVSLEIAITQKLTIYNEMLMDLTNSSKTINSLANSNELKAEIEEMLSASQENIINSLGDAVSDAATGIGSGINTALDGVSNALSGLSKPLVYGIIAIIAIVIIFMFLKVFLTPKQPTYQQFGGGRMDGEEDVTLFEEL